MIMISACLAGLKCRYSGDGSYNADIEELVKSGEAILVCPEQMGGCPTPRKPCEIASKATGQEVLEGKAEVIDSQGRNHTAEFLNGAAETLKVAQLCDVSMAILKSKSPSCGSGRIYDGSFSGKLTDGNGVTAQLLINNGYKVFTEENYAEHYFEKSRK